MNSALSAAPREVVLNQASQSLELLWQNQERELIPFRRLRLNCGCASCRAARLLERFEVADDVRVKEARLFGVAGLQLLFSDGHERGVFPWQFLKELAGMRD